MDATEDILYNLKNISNISVVGSGLAILASVLKDAKYIPDKRCLSRVAI